ncbi:hypothetical protein K2X83_00800 [Patescibacteria group bacterium]|nr:hypothetical protein [Patescibacteria group bacterium]
MYAKIVTTVPVASADMVRKAVGDAIGIDNNYSHASFSVRGIGHFIPHPGANPTIGSVGELQEVPEDRIEWVCRNERVLEVVKVLRSVHPYEAPLIDVYPLESV